MPDLEAMIEQHAHTFNLGREVWVIMVHEATHRTPVRWKTRPNESTNIDYFS